MEALVTVSSSSPSGHVVGDMSPESTRTKYIYLAKINLYNFIFLFTRGRQIMKKCELVGSSFKCKGKNCSSSFGLFLISASKFKGSVNRRLQYLKKMSGVVAQLSLKDFYHFTS